MDFMTRMYILAVIAMLLLASDIVGSEVQGQGNDARFGNGEDSHNEEIADDPRIDLRNGNSGVNAAFGLSYGGGVGTQIEGFGVHPNRGLEHSIGNYHGGGGGSSHDAFLLRTYGEGIGGNDGVAFGSDHEPALGISHGGINYGGEGEYGRNIQVGGVRLHNGGFGLGNGQREEFRDSYVVHGNSAVSSGFDGRNKELGDSYGDDKGLGRNVGRGKGFAGGYGGSKILGGIGGGTGLVGVLEGTKGLGESFGGGEIFERGYGNGKGLRSYGSGHKGSKVLPGGVGGVSGIGGDYGINKGLQGGHRGNKGLRGRTEFRGLGSKGIESGLGENIGTRFNVGSSKGLVSTFDGSKGGYDVGQGLRGGFAGHTKAGIGLKGHHTSEHGGGERGKAIVIPIVQNVPVVQHVKVVKTESKGSGGRRKKYGPAGSRLIGHSGGISSWMLGGMSSGHGLSSGNSWNFRKERGGVLGKRSGKAGYVLGDHVHKK